MIASESDFRDNPHWMMRLLLRCLFVAASLSLVLQFTAAEPAGFRDTGKQFHLTTATVYASVALGKSSQTLKNTRKHSTRDGGPDTAPEVPVFGDLFSYQGRTGLASRLTYSAYIAEHILFRNGSSAISARAPPKHFSS